MRDRSARTCSRRGTSKIRRANKTDKGLAAHFFTPSKNRMFQRRATLSAPSVLRCKVLAIDVPLVRITESSGPRE